MIMTSNIASQMILGYKGQDYERMKEQALDILRQSFRPEFLNRVDEIVVFHPLTRDQLRQIVDVQMVRLGQRLEERKIELELTDKARDYLAEHGYDPSYGARPLRRLIQRELETALGRKLLLGRDSRQLASDRRRRRARTGILQPAARRCRLSSCFYAQSCAVGLLKCRPLASRKLSITLQVP